MLWLLLAVGSLSLSLSLKCACICVCFSMYDSVYVNQLERVCAHDINIRCKCMCMFPHIWRTFHLYQLFSLQSNVKLTAHQIIWIQCIRLINFLKFFGHSSSTGFYIDPKKNLFEWRNSAETMKVVFELNGKLLNKIHFINWNDLHSTVWLHLHIHTFTSFQNTFLKNWLFCHANCQIKRSCISFYFHINIC